jgi:hypothetical protein
LPVMRSNMTSPPAGAQLQARGHRARDRPVACFTCVPEAREDGRLERGAK